MLEYMVACGDATDMTFDGEALATAATGHWPGTNVIHPTGGLETLVEVIVEITFPTGICQFAVHLDGTGISLDATTPEDAAEVLAWLARTADVPADGSVVVVHWTSDLYPLRPGVTAEELLADYPHT